MILFRSPLILIAKTIVCAILAKYKHGQLRITYSEKGSINGTDSKNLVFGSGLPCTEVFVVDEWFWVRILLSGSKGFSEAYMLGEIDCDDLFKIFTICLANRGESNRLDKGISTISALISYIEPTNTIDRSRLNVARHYDLSNDIFKAFLSPDMTYSCGLWLSKSHPDYIHDTLEKSQKRKYQYHISAARIQSSDHILEIGTGWGSFAIQAVQETGCRVTTVTLSEEQKQLAEERIRIAGLEDKITILLIDYREIPRLGKKFDKVISIEMLEHVGLEYLHEYFATISELLTENGIATFQASIVKEAYQAQGNLKNSFIRTYIFPGGVLPSLTQIIQAVHKGTRGSLAVDRVESFAGYGRVLQEWSDNFDKNFTAFIEPEIVKANPYIDEIEIEAFRRKWMFYFAYCRAGFDSQVLTCGTIRLRRNGMAELGPDA